MQDSKGVHEVERGVSKRHAFRIAQNRPRVKPVEAQMPARMTQMRHAEIQRGHHVAGSRETIMIATQAYADFEHVHALQTLEVESRPHPRRVHAVAMLSYRGVKLPCSHRHVAHGFRPTRVRVP